MTLSYRPDGHDDVFHVEHYAVLHVTSVTRRTVGRTRVVRYRKSSG